MGTLVITRGERERMPPRSNPTVRQQRLGAELRKLREQAGLSTQQAAAVLATDRTVITSTEAGRHGISPERVRRLACNYDCPDKALVDALAEMAGERGKGWWEKYRGILPPGFLDIAELEWHAEHLKVAVIAHLPGQLQTEGYARVLFGAVLPQLPVDEREARISHRTERHKALERDSPPPYTAIIHEAALRMQFGGRKVMRAQLEHLLMMTGHDNICIRVIPFAAGIFPGAGQAILYAGGSVRQLDTVQLDSTHGAEFLHTDLQLKKYGSQLDWVGRMALSDTESKEFIRDIMKHL